MSAPSHDMVWALANARYLFFSRDRGATWALRSLPDGSIVDVSFISETVGWVESRDGPTAVTLWRTTDGAASWQVARTLSDLQSGEVLTGLTLVNGQRAFVTGIRAGQAPVVYRTADGGATWSRSAPVPASAGQAAVAGPVLVAGAELLVAVGSEVFRSLDGGTTWPQIGAGPNGTPIGALVTAMRWVSSPGRDGVATDDAGHTWQPWAMSYSQAAPVRPEIAFADASVGYATVRGSLQRTDDAGATWVMLATPGT